MQYLESSIIGLRSAVITLKHGETALSFTLFPMVHVAEPAFFAEVANGARECDLIVAEGAPEGTAPIEERMARLRHDHLVDQTAALHLERLGVPVQWEATLDELPKTRRARAVVHTADAVGAVVSRALGRYGSPLGMRSLDQSDEHDAGLAQLVSPSFVTRLMRTYLIDGRDKLLVESLTEIHRTRCEEHARIAVVYGAAHIPAVVDHLTEKLGYYVADAEWLMVVNAPS